MNDILIKQAHDVLSGESDNPEELRRLIVELAARYSDIAHKPKPFVPGSSFVPVSGKVHGATEMQLLVEASLDFWLTTGRFNDAFEKRLKGFLGSRFAMTCNSGSSANLLAASALCSPLVPHHLKPGDEVITCATGFPTTVNPILQNQLVPVFLDVHLPTYNIRSDLIEDAITSKTRAIMVAHTLGNPFDLDTVLEVARKHDLFVVEDTCDALGATYNGTTVGTLGDIGTVSFYPAHHITMGEGGAVFTNKSVLKRALESIRDWGRDCWCEPGKDNTCKQRFNWQLGDLPEGYDHKYTYSNIGYNLKITDMQAAVALGQMDRLEGFIADRRRNFAFLKEALKPLEEFLILPEATPKSDPSWFGLPLTVRDGAPFTRNALIRHLEDNKIATRLLFGGNLIRQPYFKTQTYRVHGDLTNSDKVMNSTFWIGVYPGLTSDHLTYMAQTMSDFCRKL
ncbi:MAG: lipopolysaccharide biosynthesis protein RfbH [Rhizobiales bacterium 32-66-11]|nr:MAG: lipopolysaccharide biosynthesis protein RfbH [Rhizobiales bacterium 32-66-11]